MSANCCYISVTFCECRKELFGIVHFDSRTHFCTLSLIGNIFSSVVMEPWLIFCDPYGEDIIRVLIVHTECHGTWARAKEIWVQKCCELPMIHSEDLEGFSAMLVTGDESCILSQRLVCCSNHTVARRWQQRTGLSGKHAESAKLWLCSYHHFSTYIPGWVPTISE